MPKRTRQNKKRNMRKSRKQMGGRYIRGKTYTINGIPKEFQGTKSETFYIFNEEGYTLDELKTMNVKEKASPSRSV